MKNEETIVRQKIRLYEIDQNNPIAEIRRRKYVENDKAIFNLVRDFDKTPNQDVLHHLRALQYRLSRFEDYI